ncbi:GNAT family N-acetyltransferase [Clostridioides sp. ES-S-0145-01]|uniref:GNAT family N-acetyltransferase n=1 Tax=Clostridioides sp. ES-S-0145-01 TaxID=2770784 RepID=UPI001D10FA4B
MKRIKIRPLNIGDIELLRKLRNEDYNRMWFINSNKISKYEQRKWFECYKHKKNDFMFIVEDKLNNTFIGSVALYDIDKDIGEFGRLIIDNSKVKNGFGYDATMGACIIGFEKLNLDKIRLEVYKSNLRAIRIYEKVGFIEINESKSSLIKCMQLEKKEFNLMREEINKNGNTII